MLRGFTPQSALDAPRLCISSGSPDTQSATSGEAGDVNSEVNFEEGIPMETVNRLRGAYHISFSFLVRVLSLMLCT